MKIYPAIDLLDGNCVRLAQGEFSASTVYSSDPLSMAFSFARAGAEFLHLVDLSGAKDPRARQLPLLRSIIQASQLRVQVGGGIRSFQDVRDILQAGADRVVIGSAAVAKPELVLEILGEFGGERLTLALDVRLDNSNVPRLALQGWQDQTKITVEESLAPFLGKGLSRVLCTDISRDGMMSGPNLELYERLQRDFPSLEFQASGGVSSLADIRALREAGLGAVVIGRALYAGAFSLEEALALC